MNRSDDDGEAPPGIFSTQPLFSTSKVKALIEERTRRPTAPISGMPPPPMPEAADPVVSLRSPRADRPATIPPRAAPIVARTSVPSAPPPIIADTPHDRSLLPYVLATLICIGAVFALWWTQTNTHSGMHTAIVDARQAFADGRYADARQAIAAARAAGAEPAEVDVLTRQLRVAPALDVAENLIDEGALDQARRWLRQAAEVSPTDARLHRLEGRLGAAVAAQAPRSAPPPAAPVTAPATAPAPAPATTSPPSVAAPVRSRIRVESAVKAKLYLNGERLRRNTPVTLRLIPGPYELRAKALRSGEDLGTKRFRVRAKRAARVYFDRPETPASSTP